MDPFTKICDRNGSFEIADRLFKSEVSPAERNLSAVAFAEYLAAGRDNKSIAEIMQYLQLVASLLKTYMK